MTTTNLNLLLADDDTDDCFFFKEALEEIFDSAKLTTVNDGVHLMELLSGKETTLPDIVFLDQNMPRKSGIECLSEIKGDENLKHLPIVILSTYVDVAMVNLLFDKGAHHFICKPAEFSALKKVIMEAITLIGQNKLSQPMRDKFIIQPYPNAK